MRVAIPLASAAILLCSATGFSQTKNGADITKDIQNFCQQFDNTWNTKGPATTANTFMADDAIFVPPNGAVLKGRAAIAKDWGDVFKEPTVHKCTVDGARAEGDGAWADGEVTITGNPATHVRWAAFDLKQDGQWKIRFLQVTAIKAKE